MAQEKPDYFKLESLAEVAAVNDLPFVCQQNAQNSYYRMSGAWLCSDRQPSNFAEVQEILRSPLFPEGVARIEKLAQELVAPAPRSRRRKARRGPQGDELDIQRVWQGDLEHAWTEIKREQTVGPSRVLIVIDIGGHCGVDSQKMALRGATALALAHKLQEAGFTISIVAIAKIQRRDERYKETSKAITEVTVLEPGHELDLHKIANLLASAILFRGVLINHFLKTCPHLLDGGCGRPLPIKLADVDSFGFDYATLLNEEKVDNVEQAQNWLQQEIATIEGAQQQ